MMNTEILIVGSGAVGAVYAAHLERAGCSVTFLVRNPESPNAAMPRQVHEISLLGRTSTVTQHVPCVTSAQGEWDQVWLCLPSTALRSEWLGDRLGELSSGTPLVMWTPDVRDRDRLEALCGKFSAGSHTDPHGGRIGGSIGGENGVPDGRQNRAPNGRPIVQGVIGFLSFQSPLPGTDGTLEGFSYVLPPVAAALLEDVPEGERAALWLRKGGLPARTRSDLAWTAGRGAAVLICTVAALEVNAWSINRLRESGDLAVVQQAAVEAIRAIATSMDRQPGMAVRLPYGAALNVALWVAKWLFPIPLETYLRFHFTKVGAQTRMMLDTWLNMAREQNHPAPVLETLRQRLDG